MANIKYKCVCCDETKPVVEIDKIFKIIWNEDVSNNKKKNSKFVCVSICNECKKLLSEEDLRNTEIRLMNSKINTAGATKLSISKRIKLVIRGLKADLCSTMYYRETHPTRTSTLSK